MWLTREMEQFMTVKIFFAQKRLNKVVSFMLDLAFCQELVDGLLDLM